MYRVSSQITGSLRSEKVGMSMSVMVSSVDNLTFRREVERNEEHAELPRANAGFDFDLPPVFE